MRDMGVAMQLVNGAAMSVDEPVVACLVRCCKCQTNFDMQDLKMLTPEKPVVECPCGNVKVVRMSRTWGCVLAADPVYLDYWVDEAGNDNRLRLPDEEDVFEDVGF